MVNVQYGKRAVCNHRVVDARGRLLSSKEVQELNEAKDCRLFSDRPEKSCKSHKTWFRFLSPA